MKKASDLPLLGVFDEINLCKQKGNQERANLLIECLKPLGYLYVMRFADGRFQSTLYYDPQQDKRNRRS